MKQEDLESLAIGSLVSGLVCAVIIVTDLLRGHPQKMRIMNIVWPVTALYAGPLGLWAYYAWGRSRRPGARPANNVRVTWQQVVRSTLHCGAGCTVGDILAESMLGMFPVVIISNPLFNSWILEYFFALITGIVFQYQAVAGMKHRGTVRSVMAVLKADVWSLTCWQVGMYGWMALAVFGIFHHPLAASGPVFWLMMQAGMIAGFCTALPVNGWLLKKGIKEAM